ncbi:MAG: NAD(P)-dependent oxidoreductase [Parcubacteria group bacterium QH_9_35_7]|nr:MAG: NAD(P)-dependent oxidoreductase [Parcubacteria group bacterium QH_9_35_7]
MGNSKTAIITGSTRGIGLATADKLQKEGYNVVIFCRHEEHAQEAKNQLIAPEKTLALTGDVRKEKDIENIVEKTIDKWGKIDILVNNAGKAIYKPIQETSLEEWEDVVDTNAKGTFLFSKKVIPKMKKEGSGKIINISSGLGLSGQANYSAYSMSKFAVVGLTEVLADELQEIKSYAVCPGGVATKLHLDIHPWENPDNMMKPEHIAEEIMNLIYSEKESGYIHKVFS